MNICETCGDNPYCHGRHIPAPLLDDLKKGFFYDAIHIQSWSVSINWSKYNCATTMNPRSLWVNEVRKQRLSNLASAPPNSTQSSIMRRFFPSHLSPLHKCLVYLHAQSSDKFGVSQLLKGSSARMSWLPVEFWHPHFLDTSAFIGGRLSVQKALAPAYAPCNLDREQSKAPRNKLSFSLHHCNKYCGSSFLIRGQTDHGVVFRNRTNKRSSHTSNITILASWFSVW